MSDAPSDPGRPGPRPTPGERRLPHPPSDRYRVVEPAPPTPDPAASQPRGLAFATGAAVAGALAITLLGGVLALSAGLIVVAAATGWGVALGLRAGAGRTLPAGRRARLALGLAMLSIVFGQLGLWLYARSEGGVLDPLDYLSQTFGLLVPVQLFGAAIVAWLAAR